MKSFDSFPEAKDQIGLIRLYMSKLSLSGECYWAISLTFEFESLFLVLFFLIFGPSPFLFFLVQERDGGGATHSPLLQILRVSSKTPVHLSLSHSHGGDFHTLSPCTLTAPKHPLKREKTDRHARHK